MTDYPDSRPWSVPNDAAWSRLPSETGKQFAYFQAYRDLPPLERSLAEVGRKSGVSVSFLERLSRRNRWIERVSAFDREADRLAQLRRVHAVAEMNDRHAEIASTALRKVAERLETLDPTSLRPADIARLLEIASKAERMARGVLSDEPVVQQRPWDISADEIRRKLKEEGLLGETVCGDPSPDEIITPAQRSRKWPWTDHESSDA